MGIITERLNANKPQPAPADPKSGKLAPGQINNNKDLDVDSKKEEPSFFGSFFAGKKSAKKGPNTPSMESVSVGCDRGDGGLMELCFVIATCHHPASIGPQ